MSRPNTLTSDSPAVTTDVTPSEARARNGGTSAPGAASVWDVAPQAPVTDTSPIEPDVPVSTPPISTPPIMAPIAPAPPIDPPRQRGPLLDDPIRESSVPVPSVAAPARPAAALPTTPTARRKEKARRALEVAAAQRAGTARSRRSARPWLLAILLAALAGAAAWALFLRGDAQAATDVPVGTLAPDSGAAPATTVGAASLAPAAAREVDDTDVHDELDDVETTEDAAAEAAAPVDVAPVAPDEMAAERSVAAARAAVADVTPTTTAAPTTTAPTTTAPTTTAPTTTAAPAVAPGPRIAIEPRTESCKYGSNCLVVGFSLSGFASQPDSFVCEFADGSRYTIPLAHMSVDYACSTGTVGGSITIEIAGVRSETVVHA